MTFHNFLIPVPILAVLPFLGLFAAQVVLNLLDQRELFAALWGVQTLLLAFFCYVSVLLQRTGERMYEVMTGPDQQRITQEALAHFLDTQHAASGRTVGVDAADRLEDLPELDMEEIIAQLEKLKQESEKHKEKV